MPHIVVFCFPAMKFETRPGLRAHPLSARRSRRSHESLGHNRSPRGRFGKMNVSGMTHLNALHRCVAFCKHGAADSEWSVRSGQPVQSVTLIRSKRELQRQIPMAFLAERDPMVAGGSTPGNMATPRSASRSDARMIRVRISDDHASIVAPRHNRLLVFQTRRFRPGLERPGYHQMPLCGKSQMPLLAERSLMVAGGFNPRKR